MSTLLSKLESLLTKRLPYHERAARRLARYASPALFSQAGNDALLRHVKDGGSFFISRIGGTELRVLNHFLKHRDCKTSPKPYPPAIRKAVWQGPGVFPPMSAASTNSAVSTPLRLMKSRLLASGSTITSGMLPINSVRRRCWSTSVVWSLTFSRLLTRPSSPARRSWSSILFPRRSNSSTRSTGASCSAIHTSYLPSI